MAVTPFQSEILKLLARQRRASGESYVAGGVALNMLLAAPRRSRGIDLFHDTEAALAATWLADRVVLEGNGCSVKPLREAASFVEAVVARGTERTAMQWARDSAFRFFPLIEDDTLGLTLHPFDLATNKLLAMAGRLEVRDWVDVIHCDAALQPFGYLAWAACGKDPGYNPHSLLAAACRLHYSQVEVDTLDFETESPHASALGERWHRMLAEAADVCGKLPPSHVGEAVIARDARLFRGNVAELAAALAAGAVLYHRGCIGGAWPRIVGQA